MEKSLMNELLGSPLFKRSVVIDGRKTSVSLEDEFWDALRAIAKSRGITPAVLIASVDADRKNRNLSSAIRVFVLEHFRSIINKKSEPPSESDLTGLSPID
jgi:predicted DNA-binding ribbon-helix-helix protein